jgi:delta1-piperideine-2-carboxylate reductase
LLTAGSSEEMANIVADTVTRAERDGSHSHGLFRIPGYVASLKSGKVNANANPKVENITPVMIRCDADNGYAPLAHSRCLVKLVDAAKTYGIAMAQITRSHHFAALWPETEALAEQGLVAFTCVSYMPIVAPYGAKEKVYGCNPISFVWPRKDLPPVVFDMATAAMAMGDIQIAARDGTDLPPGTGLNRDGEPTTDPKDIDPTTGGGMILPFGGYKDSHIAMMVELLHIHKRGRRDFKLTNCERVTNLVSPVTKKARELLCRDVQGCICQSYRTIWFKEAIIEKPAS